jgi:hypothetical protein
VALGVVGACRRDEPAEQQVLLWRPVNTWSGSTSLQTESFPGAGAFRVEWESREQPGAAPGSLKITLHSAVSGRPLAVVVDHEGAGHASAYVAEDPRDFYLVIESQRVDWSVKLEEGIRALSRPGGTT